MASYGQSQYGLIQYGQQSLVGTVDIRQQDPAPNQESVLADSPVRFEVFLDPSGFDLSTVDVYVNQTMIYSSSTPLGFDVSVNALSDGFSFVITNPSLWETGEQNIRVVAGPPVAQLDTTYSFSTSVFVPTPEDIESLQNQAAGLDLRLTSTDHDISVSASDLSLVAGADEVAQHLGVGLRLFRGEWYLDDLAGVPYYQSFFVSAPNTRTIETTLRQELQGDPDIDSLSEFELEIDRATRKLSVSFVAESVFGDVEVEAVFP